MRSASSLALNLPFLYSKSVEVVSDNSEKKERKLTVLLGEFLDPLQREPLTAQKVLRSQASEIDRGDRKSVV